jgi:MYXO-CTERM domain-containing protein
MEGFVSIATDWPRPLLDKEIVGGGKINVFTNTYRIARTAIAAIATSAIVVFIPRPAQALVPIFTGSGSGFSIPDKNPTGAFSDIEVPDNFLINAITVGLNSLTHSWIGDLIATLTHADTNTTVDLFNRVGVISSGFGASSNLKGSYNFNDTFTGDLWTVESSVENSSIIPGGGYFPTGPDSSAKVPMLTTISGLSSSGTWRLKISDVFGGEIGTLDSWSLNLQGSSPGVVFTGSGLGFSIPDNNPTGAFSDIVVADNFLINDITVGLSLSHPWIGDLIATLTHADTNTTVDLFNRVDAISSGIGHGSNLNGSYYFNDAFTGDLWTVASSVANSSIIPGGDYFPTGPDFSAKVPMLTTISGLSSSGTWRLKISDVSGNDTGTLGSWSLTLQGSSPESVPGPLPLLGAGAAFGWSRRLRKRSRAAL